MTETLRAGERLHRLLAVLAYLARVGEAPISELAERFSLSPRTLVAELELAACCGLPPYTPDQLLELVVDEDRVAAYGLEALQRTPRLTPEEGLAVAAAARALLAVPGADGGPLASALRKLEAALGEDRLQVEVDVPLDAAPLSRAVADHEVVEIDYLGAFRGAESSRAVEPHALSVREGRTYLDAWCRVAKGWRRFALDRITAVRALGETFEPRELPDELSTAGAFTGGGDTKTVRLAMPLRQAAVFDQSPGARVQPDGDRALVELEVGDERYLGLLLLRLGEDAVVLEPAELADARANAARRALRRYRP